MQSPHLGIAAAVLASASLGEAQIRRARKALTDLTILMLDGSGGVVGQRNRSFGRASCRPRPLSWSISRAWSAVRQLQAIAGGLPVPRPHEREREVE